LAAALLCMAFGAMTGDLVEGSTEPLFSGRQTAGAPASSGSRRFSTPVMASFM